jgi:AraC-like DNA-binding protein
LRCGYRVGEICAELHCGPRYLHEVFLRDVGLPPKAWMCRERMEVARRLIAVGETPQAIAERLGFTLAGNFRREFLRHRPWEINVCSGRSSEPGLMQAIRFLG